MSLDPLKQIHQINQVLDDKMSGFILHGKSIFNSLISNELSIAQFKKKINNYPMEGHWKFLGGEDVKSQNFRSKVHV